MVLMVCDVPFANISAKMGLSDNTSDTYRLIRSKKWDHSVTNERQDSVVLGHSQVSTNYTQSELNTLCIHNIRHDSLGGPFYLKENS